MKPLDAIVVGGGPAGLSAALLLGRCNRTVVVLDEGHPRNAMSARVHCYLGLPASSPQELLELGRAQLSEHPNVRFISDRAEGLVRGEHSFEVALHDGTRFESRAVIVTTGLIDELPEVPGLRECYGTSVFPCPYCDGWENRGGKLGVIGPPEASTSLAEELLLWSSDVALFAPSPECASRARQALGTPGFRVYASPMIKVRHDRGRLSGIELEDGQFVDCSALFVVPDQRQPHTLLERMGCELNDDSQSRCDEWGATRVPGLFVAGNAREGLQLAMVAAGDGLKCAAAANEWLLNRKDSRR